LFPAEVAWSIQLDAAPSGAGAMDGIRVYVPLQNGELHAFDRETGERLWDSNGATSWPPVPGGQYVFIASPYAVRAFDGRTGGARWVAPLPANPSAPMTLVGDTLFVATDDGALSAIRAGEGVVAWTRPLGSPTPHSPAPLEPDAIVVALADGRVVALDRDTGNPRWEQVLPPTVGAPAAARDRVLVGSTNNFFYALDAESGEIEWRWRTGGDVVGAASDAERIYFVSLENILRGVSLANGNQQWKTEVPTRSSAPPVAFDGLVVLTGVGLRIDTFVAKTGASAGFYEAPADLQGPPLIDRVQKPFRVGVAVLTRDGRLIALRPEKMMFRDPAPVPLLQLPGRTLPREARPRGDGRLPSSARP
jgi:outer membrane protein assembly factor BamB